MPLLQIITDDMFEVEGVADFMVNPVNLMGVSGAGLAAVFKTKAPNHIEPYKEACRTKELRIGTVQVFLDTDQSWGMINLPTKRHFKDTSDPDDIKRGLIALRELLLTDKYRYASIVLPMLGCGLGLQDYSVVYPMMEEHLGDLEACIFISMSPKRTELRPRYLTICGPLDYGKTDEEKAKIDWVVDQCLERKMQMRLEDYTGIVSGGHPGVDAYIAGTHYGKAVGETPDEIGYQDTFAYKRTGKLPIVVHPNKARNGIGANLHQSNLLCEIGEDVILIKPKGHNNNRLSTMQIWLESNNAERERTGLLPRRVAVFGDNSTSITNDDPMIPQVDDMPY